MGKFDLTSSTTKAISNFGVAVRAPLDTVDGADQKIEFFVSAADSNGVRNLTVGGNYQDSKYKCSHICPSNVTQLLPGEALDVRVLVDRPIVEVFVMGGRIAYAHADAAFSMDRSSVHIFNDAAVPVSTSGVFAYGMGCGWRDDMPQPKVSVPPRNDFVV